MVRPTYDDLREEDQPGTLERERLERLAPTMQARITELEGAIRDYLSEYDNLAPDSLYRAQLRARLRGLLPR